jgi:hypothetical protein
VLIIMLHWLPLLSAAGVLHVGLNLLYMLRCHVVLSAAAAAAACLRSLQVVGGLHHGKTTLLDMLVEQTHDVAALGIRNSQGKPLRFTDTRVDEQVCGCGGDDVSRACSSAAIGVAQGSTA